MARNNYNFEKRQRELSKERKKEEKRQKKLERKSVDEAPEGAEEPGHAEAGGGDDAARS